jgi:peptidylprolyl isomerase
VVGDGPWELEERPAVEIPEDEPPPTELVVEELVAGDGPAVAADDDVVTVQLVGVNWETGERVVSSWGRSAPRTFALHTLVPGVRDGLEGMNVGSRRRIVVPPELGYGDDGPPTVGPDDTVVFVIDLVSLGQEGS